MKLKNEIIYSPEELALIGEARPKPFFENVHWDERDMFFTHHENSWRCSFEMFDAGLHLIDPLEIAGFERIDIINGKTGRILLKDCGSGDFIYESPVSGWDGRFGSYILGPVIDITYDEYLGMLESNLCLIIRNIVFSNDVVEMVAGRFICPIDASDENRKITLTNVSYRFSDKIKDLPFEKKAGLVRRHPDVEFENAETTSATITKEEYPSASTLYCSGAAKEAYEKGGKVEAAIVRMSFVDKNHELSSGIVSFEAKLEGLNRKKPNSKFAVLNVVSGIADEKGRFKFETVMVLGASKEEVQKEWGNFDVDSFNVDLRLKVLNGFSVETFHDGITVDGPLCPETCYSSDNGHGV